MCGDLRVGCLASGGKAGGEVWRREKGHRDMDSGSDHGLGLGFCLLGIMGFKVALRERKARRGL